MENPLIIARPRFAQRFWPLVGLGLIGVASLPLSFLPALRTGRELGVVPDVPLAALAALLLVNPLVLLLVAAALGAALAHRVGLHALVASEVAGSRWSLLRRAAPLAIGLGLLLAVVSVLIDLAAQPWLSTEWAKAATNVTVGPWSSLLVGILYGGILEEILLRWGLMALIAWAGWRLFGRDNAGPGPAVMWSAIVLAALLFGAGHLPTAAAMAPLDATLVLRTVLLNALGGLVFGWLFWRRHLEAAMLGHASTHLGFALLRWGGMA